MVSLCYYTYSVFMAVYKSVIFINIVKNILLPMKMIFTCEKKSLDAYSLDMNCQPFILSLMGTKPWTSVYEKSVTLGRRSS